MPQAREAKTESLVLDIEVFLFHYRVVNPDKLSLLSDQELMVLANHMRVFIPEGLDRLFVMEEILAALEDEDESERVFSHDGTGHVEEKKLSGAAYAPFAQMAEAAVLPERYSETMIRALPRDPAWIYAYWDVSERKRTFILEDEGANDNLFLRVIELKPSGEHRRDFFDIGVSLDDWKWYINIPQPGSVYRVDLCLRKGDAIKILARSNEVRMPVYYMRRTPNSAQMTKSLLILSDIEGLHLTEPKDENPARIMASDGE